MDALLVGPTHPRNLRKEVTGGVGDCLVHAVDLSLREVPKEDPGGGADPRHAFERLRRGAMPNN